MKQIFLVSLLVAVVVVAVYDFLLSRNVGIGLISKLGV